jgi:tetratricopeptide (TPR) repeat protein
MKKSVRSACGLGLLVLCLNPASAQQTAPRQVLAAAQSPKTDKAAAYFNYSMAHIFADLAASSGNKSEYLNPAIEFYKNAIKADPKAGFMSTELSDLYVQAGLGNRAVTESEAALKSDPNDLSARRILGRIYARLIGDPQANRIREDMVRKAIDQYQKITDLEPTDIESWVMLGRLAKVGQDNAGSEKAYKKVLELDPDNEDALSGLAMAAAESGDVAGAAAMLEKAGAKNPNPRAMAQLAEMYEQMKDYRSAAKAWQKALDLSGGNPEIKRQLAENLLLGGQVDEAVRVYEELVEDEPKDIGSILRISQIYQQKRNFAKAREFVKKAKDLDPTNLDARFNEVVLLDSEGKSAEALAALKDMLDSTARRSYLPTEKTVRISLLERYADMQRRNEKFAEAVKSFEEIQTLDPSATTANKVQAQIVETWRQAKDYPKADALADDFLKKNPNDRMMRRVKAIILSETGKAPEGADLLTKLLDGKEDREIHIAIAGVWEKGRNYTEMAKSLDAASKLSQTPDEQETITFMRGAMLEKQKNFDAAEAEFQKILKADPNNAGALNYLGYMLVDRNVRVPEGLAMIQKALEQDPNNGAYLDSLGWAYYRLDKLDDAAKYLQMAIERSAKDPTVHDHYADVLLKQGKTKEAVAAWERSLAEWASTAPSDKDSNEIAKVQKKLDAAKARLARESTTRPRKN